MGMSMEQTGSKFLRIELDTDRCTGLGLCESLAPSFFEVQDDGSLTILRFDVRDDEMEEVRSAIAACPTEALRLVSE
jgi:ferredoxin